MLLLIGLYSTTFFLLKFQYFKYVNNKLQVIPELICPPAATIGGAEDAISILATRCHQIIHNCSFTTAFENIFIVPNVKDSL